jgi:arylsulfatase A-like enzyme/Tfp pilus assembly protein PilF
MKDEGLNGCPAGGLKMRKAASRPFSLSPVQPSSPALHPSSFILHPFLILLLLFACNAKEHPRYNVLLITLDTTRADHINGNTPALLALQKSGVSFANADSPVPLTLPAHSSILSGVIPPHHGLRNNGGGAFPADRETLATTFQRAGYRTGAFVGAFVLDHRFGLDRGFDRYDDDIVRDPADASLAAEAERRGSEVVDRALAWLQQPDGRPFFAWVHLYDPHAPYAPPAPYPQTYDGELAYTDAQVARLLATIDRTRTIIAVAGDHGEGLGEHGELTHGLLLYEPTLHVPMIISAPETPSRVVDDPVSTIDLAPTLATLAGSPMSGPLDGVDLFSGKAAGRDLYAETEYPAQFGWSDLTAARRGAMKLIRSPQPEIYDLARDPKEKSNQLDGQRRLYSELSATLDRIATTAVKGGTTAVDEETRSKLASLGYIAPSGAQATGASRSSRRNPEQMVSAFRDFEEAHRLMQIDQTDAALRIMERLVAADPENAVFRASLAHTWRLRGNLPRAIELYREAAGQTPDDPEAWYNLAAVFQEHGEQQKAEAAIGEVLRRDPNRPEAHNVLAIALASTGKLDEAKRELERAIAIDPHNARAFNNLGNVDRARNQPAEAEHSYRRAIELAPRYADPLNGLGALLVERDRPRDAIPLFDRAISLSTGYYEARLNRAVALAQAGERPRAVEELRTLVRVTAARPDAAPQRRAAEQLLGRLGARP